MKFIDDIENGCSTILIGSGKDKIAIKMPWRIALPTCQRDNHFTRSFDAFILDLNGVITKIAKVHAAAWKGTLDDHLARHHPNGQPFTIEHDYLNYVDGKPRGVCSFLASWSITLSKGYPDDPPTRGMICGFGKTIQLFHHDSGG